MIKQTATQETLGGRILASRPCVRHPSPLAYLDLLRTRVSFRTNTNTALSDVVKIWVNMGLTAFHVIDCPDPNVQAKSYPYIGLVDLSLDNVGGRNVHGQCRVGEGASGNESPIPQRRQFFWGGGMRKFRIFICKSVHFIEFQLQNCLYTYPTSSVMFYTCTVIFGAIDPLPAALPTSE